MKIFRSLSLSVLFFILAGMSTMYAQRLIPGQWESYASWGAGIPRVEGAGLPFTVEAGMNRVQRHGKLSFHAAMDVQHLEYLSAANGNFGYEQELSIPSRNMDIFAGAGYFFDVLHGRRRAFNVWAGLSADIGVRLRREEGAPQGSKNDVRLPSSGLLMGVTPQVRMELFVSSATSFSLSVNPSMHWFTRSSRDAQKGQYDGDDVEPFFFPYCSFTIAHYMFIGK